MKTFILLFTALISFFTTITNDANNALSNVDKSATQKIEDCFFNEHKLYGKIKLVEFAGQADIKVQIVNSFPDLKVQFVESFPDKCGEWQIVEFGADLKVFITESFADIKIQPVGSFPGLP